MKKLLFFLLIGIILLKITNRPTNYQTTDIPKYYIVKKNNARYQDYQKLNLNIVHIVLNNEKSNASDNLINAKNYIPNKVDENAKIKYILVYDRLSNLKKINNLKICENMKGEYCNIFDL